MALRKKAQSISKNQIRAGQVLEIEYTNVDGEKDTAMILVTDPEYNGKLHALKLTNLSETEMENLIREIRSVNRNNTVKTAMYDALKNTPYTVIRPYRTYIKNNINSVKRITLGQPVDPQTIKYTKGNSVLYGVTHGQYVNISQDDYDVLYEELHKTSYTTYFEGAYGHEEITQVLLKLILGNAVYKESSWEPPHDPNLYLVTELFGAEADASWNNINRGVKEDNIDVSGKRLIDVVAETSAYWSDRKDRPYTVGEIQALLNTAKGDTSIYSDLFSEISKERFLKFQKRMMIQAFASYEGKRGEQFVGSPLEIKQKAVTAYRQTHLKNMMQTKPGVYFAGLGHVEDFIRGI